jgi:hypothetical protein
MRQTTYGYTPPTRASVIISLQHPDHTSCLQLGCKKHDCKGNRVERVEGGVCPTLLACHDNQAFCHLRTVLPC